MPVINCFFSGSGTRPAPAPAPVSSKTVNLPVTCSQHGAQATPGRSPDHHPCVYNTEYISFSTKPTANKNVPGVKSYYITSFVWTLSGFNLVLVFQFARFRFRQDVQGLQLQDRTAATDDRFYWARTKQNWSKGRIIGVTNGTIFTSFI